MLRGLLLTTLCIAYAIPSVVGSAILVPKLSTASCSGHFQDIAITSITCGYSDHACTYGSEVFVTGQVTSDSDFPRPMKVRVSRTLPSFYRMGTNVYNSEVEDICESNTLVSPDGDDSEYSCPSSGSYNFNFIYQNFGGRKKWYAGWYGFSMGLIVHFKYEGGGDDYATCTINVKVEGSQDESIATNAAFVSVATLGLASLFTGLFVRRRKERLAESDHENHGERTKELGTHFELVKDSCVV